MKPKENLALINALCERLSVKEYEITLSKYGKSDVILLEAKLGSFWTSDIENIIEIAKQYNALFYISGCPTFKGVIHWGDN